MPDEPGPTYSDSEDLDVEYVELDDGGEAVLLKAHLAGADGPEGDSSQPNVTEPTFGGSDETITPPFDPYQLAALSSTASTRKSIIDAVARNTVGLGYSIEVAPGHERDEAGEDPEAELMEVADELEALARRDHRMGHPTFAELLMAVKTDEEEVGQGFLEVSRDQITGRPDGIYHLPGKQMRRFPDGKGWVMVDRDGVTEKGTRFYDFGEKVQYERDGQPKRVLQRGRRKNTNEVVEFRLYTSESRDYGLPRDVALLKDYLGDKLAGESNVSFFDASGTPPTVIFVQGEEVQGASTVRYRVPRQTVNRIAGTLKADGGHMKRVAIIGVPPGTKTDVHKLGEVPQRDMGYVEFRKDNRQRALAAFRMSPIFIADTGSAGRYTAEVERAITLEQVFDPEQDRYEAKLSLTLLNDMGHPDKVLRFKKLAVENDAAKRDSADKMAEVGNITNREHRAAHGYGPIPEADTDDADEAAKGGKVPKGWNDQLVSKESPEKADERMVEGTDTRGLTDNQGGRPPSDREASQNGTPGDAVAAQ